MEDVLKKVYDESWEEDKYEDLEDCIYQCCDTYESYGALMARLLDYHGGLYDDKAMRLLVEMMEQYIDENI